MKAAAATETVPERRLQPGNQAAAAAVIAAEREELKRDGNENSSLADAAKSVGSSKNTSEEQPVGARRTQEEIVPAPEPRNPGTTMLRRSNSNTEQSSSQPLSKVHPPDRVRAVSTGDMSKLEQQQQHQQGESSSSLLMGGNVPPLSSSPPPASAITELRGTIASVNPARAGVKTKPDGVSATKTTTTTIPIRIPDTTHTRPPLPTQPEKKLDLDTAAGFAAKTSAETSGLQPSGPSSVEGNSQQQIGGTPAALTRAHRQPLGPVAGTPVVIVAPHNNVVVHVVNPVPGTSLSQQSAVPVANPPHKPEAGTTTTKTKKKGRFTLLPPVVNVSSNAPLVDSVSPSPPPLQPPNASIVASAAPEAPVVDSSPLATQSVTKGRFTVSTESPISATISAPVPSEPSNPMTTSQASLEQQQQQQAGSVHSLDMSAASSDETMPPSPPPLPVAIHTPGGQQASTTVTKGRFKVSTTPTPTIDKTVAAANAMTLPAMPKPKPTNTRGRTQSLASDVSSSQATTTPVSTDASSTVPVVRKKGRFVVTNVVTMVPVAQDLVGTTTAGNALSSSASSSQPATPTSLDSPLQQQPSSNAAEAYLSPATMLVSTATGHLVQQPLLYATTTTTASSSPPSPPRNPPVPSEGPPSPGLGATMAPPVATITVATAALSEEPRSGGAPPAQRRPVSAPRQAGWGGQQQPSMGKTFYLLDQLKLEATEADKTMKTLLADNKHLKNKVKEKEVETKDLRRMLEDERKLRETSELKVRSLKKKLKTLKQESLAGEFIEMQQEGGGALIVPEGRVSRASSVDLDADGPMYASTASLPAEAPLQSGLVVGDVSAKRSVSDASRENGTVEDYSSVPLEQKGGRKGAAAVQCSKPQSTEITPTKATRNGLRDRALLQTISVEPSLRSGDVTPQPRSPQVATKSSQVGSSPKGPLHSSVPPVSVAVQSTDLQQLSFAQTNHAGANASNVNLDLPSTLPTNSFDPLHAALQAESTSSMTTQVMNQPNVAPSPHGQVSRPLANNFNAMHQPHQAGSIDPSMQSVEHMQMMMSSSPMLMMNQGMAVPIVGMTTSADGTPNLVGFQSHAMMQMAGQPGYTPTGFQPELQQPHMMHSSSAQGLQDLQQPMLFVSRSTMNSQVIGDQQVMAMMHAQQGGHSRSRMGSQVVTDQQLMAIHEGHLHGNTQATNDSWNQQGQWSQPQAVAYQQQQQQLGAQSTRPEYVRGNSGRIMNSTATMQPNIQQQSQWTQHQQVQWSQSHNNVGANQSSIVTGMTHSQHHMQSEQATDQSASMQANIQQQTQWTQQQQQQAQWSQAHNATANQSSIGSGMTTHSQLVPPEQQQQQSTDPFEELMRRPSKPNARQ